MDACAVSALSMVDDWYNRLDLGKLVGLKCHGVLPIQKLLLILEF